MPLKLEKITEGFGYHIRKANYYIADTPKPGFKLHPAFYDENGKEISYFLYSAYEGSLYRASAKVCYDDNVHINTSLNDDDFICSIAGKKPISGQNLEITRPLYEQYCVNRGHGWHCETIKALSAIKLLMMIEFGTMNFQTALSHGIVDIVYVDTEGANHSSTTGSTRVLGNETGIASITVNTGDGEINYNTEDGKVAVSYRGIENPYGNIWRFIQGINVWGDGNMAGGQPYICSNFNYNELTHSEVYHYEGAGFTLPNHTADANGGFVSAMGYGSERFDWLFIPTEIKGTNALPVGDWWFSESDVYGHRVVRHGGSWSYGLMAGMFAGTSNTIYTKAGNATGCRLTYIPTA